MLRAPTDGTPPATKSQPRASGVERAAWAFYIIAAAGSSIGQIWVGVEIPPWPDTVPLWTRALLVAPFAVVIDLGGAVAAAFADTRRRLGEAAYGWRLLSAAAAALAVGINIAGHASSPYLAIVFGGLGLFAYTVWLLHSSSRRRDALRASGKLRHTTPAYGLLQWKREPVVTWRARALATDHGYGLVRSLALAREELAIEARRAALARHIEAKIRERHADDPILASIAAATTPLDDIARHLIDISDAYTWAQVINAEIKPPGLAPAASAPLPRDGDGVGSVGSASLSASNGEACDEISVPSDLARILPANPSGYERWRQLWAEINNRPDATNKELAEAFSASVRTVQRVRAVGAAGLLASATPPGARVVQMATVRTLPPPAERS